MTKHRTKIRIIFWASFILLVSLTLNVYLIRLDLTLSSTIGSLEKMVIRDTMQDSVRGMELDPVKAGIIKVAEKEGFEDLKLLFHLARYESMFDPFAIAVNKDRSVDRGVFQWNNKYHPEVTNECAFNVECATEKTIELLKKGRCKEWTTCPL